MHDFNYRQHFNSYFWNAIGSLVGGLLQSSGQRDTNRTNLQIARETNQLNRAMFDDQLEYNEMMWNKQNEYNDPLAQRSRLEAAGLNPLFFGLDGTGNASGWQSATPVPAQAANMQNPMQGIANGLMGISDARLKESQTKNTDAKTITENLMRTGMIESQYAQIRLFDGQLELTKSQQKQVDRSIDQMDTQLSIMSDSLQNEKRRTDIAQQAADTEKFKADILAADTRSKIEERDASISKMSTESWALGQQIAIAYGHLAVDQMNASTNSRMADIAQQNADINQQNADTSARMADIAQQNADINQQNADTNRLLADSTIELNGHQMKLVDVQTEKGKHEIKLVDAEIETEKQRRRTLNAQEALAAAQTVTEACKAANAILDFISPF